MRVKCKTLTKKKHFKKNDTSTIGGRRVSCLHFTAFSSKRHDRCDGKNAVDVTRRTQTAHSYVTIASSANKLYSVPSLHRRTFVVKLFCNVFERNTQTHTALLFRRKEKKDIHQIQKKYHFPVRNRRNEEWKGTFWNSSSKQKNCASLTLMV